MPKCKHLNCSIVEYYEHTPAYMDIRDGKLIPCSPGGEDYQYFGYPEGISKKVRLRCLDCGIDRVYYKNRLPKQVKTALESEGYL